MKEFLLNRYYGGEDFRFPALKSRFEPFIRFQNAPRGKRLEVEGIFIYDSQSKPAKPDAYMGYLDLNEEYKLLNLKPPVGKQIKILCVIPSTLINREELISSPNIIIKGNVVIDRDKRETKHLEVDEVKIVPLEYNAIGAPAFDSLDTMFEYIYSRSPEYYENEPKVLLASLIGSFEKDIVFPNENAGCGINIGASRKDIPGKISGNIIRSKDIDDLNRFIQQVSIEPINRFENNLHWSRFVFQDLPENVLSRTSPGINEVNWNIGALIENMSNWKNLSNFTSSDLNVAFGPKILFPKIKKDDINNIKQTLLFAKTGMRVKYERDISALIEVKTEKLLEELGREVNYAPFLFRYRFKPLCDAFIKGNYLGDYQSKTEIKPSRNDINSFFKIVDNIAIDFIDFSKEYIDLKPFDNILGEKSVSIKADRRFLRLYTTLLIKGHMSYNEMILFLIDKCNLSENKAISMIEELKNHEPAIIIEKNNGLTPIYF